MTPGTLHHIGFVVADIRAAMPGFASSLAGDWDGRIWEDPIQQVKVAFLHLGSNRSQIELVEPASPSAPVLRFLNEKGGGLHHLCYEVEDMEGGLREMRSRGALLVRPPKPAVAFSGRRIAWLLTAEKLLIELLERAPEL